MLRAAQITLKTDTGRQRRDNEDSAYARAPVFVVADGMGGAQAGEVASRMAVEAFQSELSGQGSLEERLAERAREANRRIYEISRSEHELAGMGTTLTAVHVGDAEVAVAHVGDSRAYRFRDGELNRLTQDHSLVAELFRRGKLTEEQAAEHPQRSIITRAIGIDPEVEIDTYTFSARSGDVILICSDGLTSMIGEDRIVGALEQERSLERAGERLIVEANEAGGRDNITVVLFALEDPGDDPAVDEPTVVGLEAADPAPARPGPGRATGATLTAPSPPPRAADASPSPSPSARPAGAGPQANVPLARRQGRAQLPTPPVRRRGPRRFAKPLAAVLSAVIVAGLIGGGGYLASRQLFFVATNPQGIVTIYSGLPYGLPLGIHLYEQVYVSGVPIALVPPSRRAQLLNHQLRSQADAISLVHAAELGQLSR